MKSIEFIGRTLKTIKGFPDHAVHQIGHELDRVQRGLDPLDWKPIPVICKRVRENHIKERGQFRIIYMAKHSNTILVLHAFRKKTQKTRLQDINYAKSALKKMLLSNMP